MANTVAGLAVSLGLNATEYFQGLTKAEYQAKKFSSSFEREMSSAVRAIKAIGIGAIINEAAQEILAAGKAIVSTAAQLSDFSDQTGSSVEALSKLSNQAHIAGTPFEELQGAVLKLSIGMGGVDKKSQQVQAALKTLGVTAKDPAEAMQQIAVAFAKYEDGATKAAYANILFGKSGAKFLATLADMARLQDVVATTTTKQAQDAEKLEQAYNRLSYESTQFKKAILDDVVPALLRVITEFNEARKAGLGFWDALKLIGSGQTTTDERIASKAKELEAAEKALATGKHPSALIPNPFWKQEAADVEKLRKELQALKGARAAALDYSAFDKEKLARLPEPPKAGSRGPKTPKDRVTEAERYLESLQKQLEKTKELTVVQTILADIEAGRIEGMTAGMQHAMLGLGAQIDAAKALEKAEKESKKLAEEEMKIREQTSKIRQKALAELDDETETLAKQNEQMRQEIEAIGLDATSLAQLTIKRLEDAAATKEQTAAMYRNTGALEEAVRLENQARQLRERKGLVIKKGVAEQMEADLAKAKEINDLFADSFADAAKSIIKNTDSIAGAFKKMGQRISDALLDMALTDIAKSLFGAPTSSGGGGIFGEIGKLIFGTLGMGGGGGSSSLPPWVIQNFRASGGPVAANQPYVVGERGPELFMPRTAGNIIPNNQMSSSRGNFVFNINVPPGASRSTIEQTRLKFGMELQNVMDRHG